MSRVKDIKQDYERLYHILIPSQESVGLAKELWNDWEKSGITRPNVDDIAANTLKSDKQFFNEIVKIASKIAKKNLNIEYCPFILDNYNLAAFSADDGYLVLIDESFFAIMFYLTIVFMFDAYNLISDNEREIVQSFINDMIDSYFNYKPFYVSKSFYHSKNITQSILKRDYEIAEFAVYFEQSMRIFMIAHEISHHILGHTKGKEKKNLTRNGENVEVETDKRDKLCEFEADAYAYKIFLEVLNTTDNSIDKAYCKYRFEFAPLFLFDLLETLDRKKELAENKIINYISHPSPKERKENLLEHYKIEDPSFLYENFREVLNDLMKS
jgi:hypothetical protein